MQRTYEEKSAFVAQCALTMIDNPTEAEEKLWTLLEPMGFRRQVVIMGFTKNGGKWFYILDFAKLDTLDGHICGGLCIEADGSSHRKRKGRDRRRDSRIAGIGIKTIRFANREILRDPSGIGFKIQHELEQR
jgi:very-short-patch-repair endonuclease